MKQRRQYERLRGDTGQNRRIMAVMALLGVLAFVPVAWRLYDLMIRSYDYYAGLALKNQTRSTSVPPQRGEIYDRNMNVLASNVSVENIYLNPRELKQSGADLPKIAADLAPILEREASWIEEQGKNTARRYMQIGWNVEADTASAASIWNRPPGGCIPAAPWPPRSSASPMPPGMARKGWRRPTTVS